MLLLVGCMELLLLSEHKDMVKVLLYMDMVMELWFGHQVVQWWL